ncbi:MAG: bifunctional folylpolyglutamate synthase/dihydrofolate synthase [Bacteroidota bacterium]
MFLSYDEVIEFLFSRLPVYQHQGAAAYKKDLTNTLLLSDALDHPENKFKSIHIAGTNGKGSVSSMLASVLLAQGYKTGLYTSPHLKDFRERMRIDGKMIPEGFVMDFVNMHLDLIDRIQPSFFELTVAMAFDWFAKEQVDFGVIEVGMGGRLDSTNIITPMLGVITNIGWDHADMLGDTLEKIAFEKAGIIKPGVPCVLGEWDDITGPVFQYAANERGAPLHIATRNPEWWSKTFNGSMKGQYQQKNMRTVWEAVRGLQSLDVEIDDEVAAYALNNVQELSGLRGRWEYLDKGNPPLIVDTGHNEPGIRLVLEQLKDIPHNHLHIILGFVKEKDLGRILPLFPKDASYYFCKPGVVRGLDAETLRLQAGACGLFGDAFASAPEALAAARSRAQAGDIIFGGGSTFVVADLM